MNIELTGEETVREVLFMHVKRYIKDDDSAKDVLNDYIAGNRDYIEWVLNDSCKRRWAHCQMSFLSLNQMCLEYLSAA